MTGGSGDGDGDRSSGILDKVYTMQVTFGASALEDGQISGHASPVQASTIHTVSFSPCPHVMMYDRRILRVCLQSHLRPSRMFAGMLYADATGHKV